MAIIHVSLRFTETSDAQLAAFTENVIAKLAGNPSFPAPPVPVPELRLVLDSFTAAMAAAAQGGKQATSAKNGAREVLLTAMRRTANYVQAASANDMTVLLSSGFQPASTNRAPSPLPQPFIKTVLNEASTQLVLRVGTIANARSYIVHYSDDGGTTWRNGIISTKAQRIVVPNLTPGKVYTFQVQAVGGSTGYSPWSNAVSHMAM
jgi:hypothetical protein